MKFKKIATVLGSALMVGSTLGFAAAAAYPAPFVQNGVANVAIVVGTAGAEASDKVAATAISTDLASELASQAVGGVKTVTGGDSYKIEKTSDKFNFGDGILDVDSSALDKKDLPTLLADGTYLDKNNDEFEYKQTVSLANLSLGLFDEDSYKRDTPTVGFDVTEGTNVLNYTLDMTDTVNWSNIQTTELPILGKMYYVLSASNTSGATLTLLDSAVSAEVNEGETKTLTVDGKTYEVSARINSASSVKFTINGESTNTLDERQTQRLSGGAYVGVKDISYNAKDSGVSSVEFSIGSGKLKLTSGEDVELNDETIDNLAVTITDTSGNDALDKVTLAWSAEKDSWITPTSEIEMPGFKAIKVAFAGMNYPKQEAIVVKTDGDDNIVLSQFPLADGVTQTINLLGSNGTNFTVVGKDSNNVLATNADGNGALTFTKNVDDYFVATYVSGEDAKSYLVRATNWDDADYPANVVDFEYLTSAGWKSLDSKVNASDEVTVGDAIFTVSSVSNESSSATVTVTPGDSTSFNKIVSAEGLTVYLPYMNTTAVVGNATNYTAAQACTAYMAGLGKFQLGYSKLLNFTAAGTYGVAQNQTTCANVPSSYTINFTEENKDDAIMGGSNFSVTVHLNSDGNTAISSIAGAGSAYEVGESNVYVSYVSSALNTKIEDDQSGDHEQVTITYHGAEATADVYVTAPTAKVVGEGATLGTVVVMDNEASAMTGKNLIVVGGNCVNSVAASLIGASAGASCLADFTSKTGVANGGFLIQSFDKGGKVALLVAGYSAQDTTKAQTYLVNQNVNTVVGTKLKGTSATEATVVTA